MKIGNREKSFFVKFIAAFFLLYALLYVFDLRFLTNFIASVQSQALALTGFPNSLDGSVISIPGRAVFEVVRECTGLVMIFMLAALLYATRTKSSLYYFAIFAPLLFVFNVVRLFATFYVGASLGIQAMEVAHVLLWFVDAAAVFFLWAIAAEVDLRQIGCYLLPHRAAVKGKHK